MSVVGVGPVGRSGDDAANQRPCQQLGEPSTGKADKEKTRTQPLQISKRQLVQDSKDGEATAERVAVYSLYLGFSKFTFLNL